MNNTNNTTNNNPPGGGAGTTGVPPASPSTQRKGSPPYSHPIYASLPFHFLHQQFSGSDSSSYPNVPQQFTPFSEQQRLQQQQQQQQQQPQQFQLTAQFQQIQLQPPTPINDSTFSYPQQQHAPNGPQVLSQTTTQNTLQSNQPQTQIRRSIQQVARHPMVSSTSVVYQPQQSTIGPFQQHVQQASSTPLSPNFAPASPMWPTSNLAQSPIVDMPVDRAPTASRPKSIVGTKLNQQSKSFPLSLAEEVGTNAIDIHTHTEAIKKRLLEPTISSNSASNNSSGSNSGVLSSSSSSSSLKEQFKTQIMFIQPTPATDMPHIEILKPDDLSAYPPTEEEFCELDLYNLKPISMRTIEPEKDGSKKKKSKKKGDDKQNPKPPKHVNFTIKLPKSMLDIPDVCISIWDLKRFVLLQCNEAFARAVEFPMKNLPGISMERFFGNRPRDSSVSKSRELTFKMRESFLANVGDVARTDTSYFTRTGIVNRQIGAYKVLRTASGEPAAVISYQMVIARHEPEGKATRARSSKSEASSPVPMEEDDVYENSSKRMRGFSPSSDDFSPSIQMSTD